MDSKLKNEIFESYKVLKSRAQCPICQEIASNPVMGSCHHMLCNFCAQKLFSLKSTVPCPVCQQAITKRGLKSNLKVSAWNDSIRELGKAIETDFGEPYEEDYRPINIERMHLSQEMTQQQAPVQEDVTTVPAVGLPPRGGKLQSSIRKLFKRPKAKESGGEVGSLSSNMETASTNTTAITSQSSLHLPPGVPLKSSSTLTINRIVDEEKSPKKNLSKRFSGSMTSLMSALVPGASKKQKLSSAESSSTGGFNFRMTPRKGSYGIEESVVAMSKKHLAVKGDEEDPVVGERPARTRSSSRRLSAVQLISVNPIESAPAPPTPSVLPAPVVPVMKVHEEPELNAPANVAETSVTLETITCQNCKVCLQIPVESLHSLSLEIAHLSGLDITHNTSKQAPPVDLVDAGVQVEQPEIVTDSLPLSQVAIIPDTAQPTLVGTEKMSSPARVTPGSVENTEGSLMMPPRHKEVYIKKKFDDPIWKLVVSLGEGSPSDHILNLRKKATTPSKNFAAAEKTPVTANPADDEETQFTRSLFETVEQQPFSQIANQSKDQVELDRLLVSLGIPIEEQEAHPNTEYTEVLSEESHPVQETTAIIPDTVPETSFANIDSVKQNKISQLFVESSQVVPINENNTPLLKALDEVHSKAIRVQTATEKEKKTTAPLSSVNQNLQVPQPSERLMAITTSGLSREEMHIVRDFLQRFHGEYHRTFIPGSTSHVVMHTMSDNPSQCERTLKYFLGIVTKSWLVSVHWCKASLEAHRLLPELPYEIQGDIVWGVDHRAPTRARESLPMHSLSEFAFSTSKVSQTCRSDLFRQFIIGLIEPLGHLSKGEAEMLIDCGGGEFLSSPSDIVKVSKRNTKKRVFLANPSAPGFSLDKCKAIYNQYKAPIVHLEWLLDSISKYEMQPVLKANAVWPKKIFL